MSDQIRKAASVIAVREGVGGPEVLVLERGATSRFLPGYVVFPGGAVDAEDGDRAHAWFGETDHAARAAAVRELAEEVGLILTAGGLAPANGRSSLDAVVAAPPAADQLVEIAHWVAPEKVPVRFDARYFAVASGPGLEPTVDGDEAAAAWWASPSTLLRDREQGRVKLYWPTYLTMTRLATCATVDELLTLRIKTREPNDVDLDRLPRSVFWQE